MNAPEFTKLPPDAVAVALLSINDIAASHSNPRKRFDETYIAELAESIKAHGLIQPITVRPIPLDSIFAFNKARKAGDETLPPTYEIVVGECRWRAAKLAGLTEIPAFWRELDDKQVLEIQVVENLQRRDVHPIEEAHGYQVLMARHGYTADAIAAKIGKSRSYVYGKLKLADLCREVRDAFFAGTLSESTAQLIARIPGEKLQKACAKEVINGYNGEPLSHRAAKQHIHTRYTLYLDRATFKTDDAALLPKAGSCTKCPKRSGNMMDLFSDITNPDVCTDPDCHAAKTQARRDALIANAEKCKIPVFLGDEGRDAMHAPEDWTSLDSDVDDDAEGRTYREILGDAIKPEALIEFPYGLVGIKECAKLTTLEAALRKAGWKPQEDEPPVTRDMTPEEKARVEAERAKRQAEAREREERVAKAEAETTRRKAQLDAIWPKLHAIDLTTPQRTIHHLIHRLAIAWLRQDAEYLGLSEMEDILVEHIGEACRLPDEYDDDVEIDRLTRLVLAAPIGRVLALLFRAHINQELVVNWHSADKPAPTIDALASLMEAQPQTAKPPKAKAEKPAFTPSNAAQAKAKSATPAAPAADQSPAKKPAAKKAKAKADPAPAKPANEAAAPPKVATLNPAHTWPFPVGARP